MSALTQIVTRAKQIYKKGGTWKGAIKKAGAEYRGKKKSAPKKKAAKRRRKISGTLSSGPRPASYAVGRVKRRRKVSGTLSSGPRPASYAIGKVSISQHLSHAKEKIAQAIASAEVRKFRAAKKTVKRKISKTITALKARYRKLC